MMGAYRVWPDGTVQDAEDTPYSWMSDDYTVVNAESEESAIRQCNAQPCAGVIQWPGQ